MIFSKLFSYSIIMPRKFNHYSDVSRCINERKMQKTSFSIYVVKSSYSIESLLNGCYCKKKSRFDFVTPFKQKLPSECHNLKSRTNERGYFSILKMRISYIFIMYRMKTIKR